MCTMLLLLGKTIVALFHYNPMFTTDDQFAIVIFHCVRMTNFFSRICCNDERCTSTFAVGDIIVNKRRTADADLSCCCCCWRFVVDNVPIVAGMIACCCCLCCYQKYQLLSFCWRVVVAEGLESCGFLCWPVFSINAVVAFVRLKIY